MKPTTILLAAFFLASCQTSGSYSRASLDDGLLQFAEAGAKDEITAARMALIEASDATAAAEHQAKHTGADRRVLGAEQRAAKDRVSREKERAKALAEVELEAGRSQQVDEALAAAKQDLETCEQKILLHDAKADVMETMLKLAKAEEAHAAAVVDLLKARALKELGREETASINLLKFDRAERDCETEIEIAKILLRSSQREVSILEERMSWE